MNKNDDSIIVGHSSRANHYAKQMILQKYIILDKIGNGKFGTVYRGKYIKTGETVAIKMENTRTSHKMLKHETTILKYLYDHGCRQIPSVHWFGPYNENLCLVMSYYDCSLYDYCVGDKLNPSKIDKIMDGCIRSLEIIHTHFVIHRDVKPQNFMLASGSLYMIDFGLATFYIDENHTHVIDTGSQDCIIGTPKYASYHIHDGKKPSRRDDLISLGYMYIYLHCRELHWDSINKSASSPLYDDIHLLNEKNVKRKELKEWETIKTTCANINEPFYRYMEYCYRLKYADLPNYAALCKLFLDSTTNI